MTEVETNFETKTETPEDGVFAAAAAPEMLQADIEALRAEVKGLSEQMAAGRRPALAAAADAGGGERKAFSELYLRQGQEAAPELKSLSTTLDSEGGYAVPLEIDRMIETVVRESSPLRAISNVVQVGSSNYRKLVAAGGFASGWVSDTAPRPETDTPAFIEVAPPMGDLYANPAASQAMLDDAAFDVESWLAAEIGREFARAEGAAVVAGTGVDMPRGFLDYAASEDADGVRAFGTLEFVRTGADGDFANGDALIDLIHALKASYRQGAAFVMNAGTLARVRKLKDADGNYLWRPGLAEGQADTLLGYKVVEAADMPDIAVGADAVAFGNFKAGYVIAERAATRILRDPYSHKPFVHFYATRRVGGAVANSEAIKLLRFSL